MNDLAQDLWNDLREKRLWPIALALLVCVIAVPVVLAKSTVEPPAPDPAAVKPPPERPDLDLEVVGGPSATAAGSSLDGFASKNPFRPPAKVVKGGDEEEAAPSSDAPSSSGGEKPASGDEPSGGDGPTTPPAPSRPPTTTQYEYVADVTFWNGNRRRSIKSMAKLDMLPSESAPLLIFMGVTRNGSNAVFLVDSTLRAAGEGRCSPSRSNCAFVRIGPGAEHSFTNEEGDSYTLRIDEIRKAKIGAGSSSRKRRADRRLANASLGDRSESRRFSMPFLSDLMVETSPGQPSEPGEAEDPGKTPSDDTAESR
jgi:hypothetical protein